ncbi:MAG: DUF742 domain-containing protein [Nocardioides sp.]
MRPFMAIAQPPPVATPPAPAGAELLPEEDSSVRPYLLTGGRVHDSDDAVEKIYQSVSHPKTRLSREHERVLALCVEAQSVAEISAHLNLPLGVVAVLARDLLQAGHLVSSAEDVDVASDVSIILRLKDAIRSL